MLEVQDKIEQIKNNRSTFIKDTINTMNENSIILSMSNSSRLNNKFVEWIKIINKYEKKSPELLIIRSLYFSENVIEFYRREYKKKNFCPYTEGTNFNIEDLKGSVWVIYKKILQMILKCIPVYIKFFYQKELNRLCSNTKNSDICETCGTENNECAIFCHICGNKIKG